MRAVLSPLHVAPLLLVALAQGAPEKQPLMLVTCKVSLKQPTEPMLLPLCELSDPTVARNQASMQTLCHPPFISKSQCLLQQD